MICQCFILFRYIYERMVDLMFLGLFFSRCVFLSNIKYFHGSSSINIFEMETDPFYGMFTEKRCNVFAEKYSLHVFSEISTFLEG